MDPRSHMKQNVSKHQLYYWPSSNLMLDIVDRPEWIVRVTYIRLNSLVTYVPKFQFNFVSCEGSSKNELLGEPHS